MREWECLFIYKRDKVGDGRECESLRESRRWQRELISDGGKRERDKGSTQEKSIIFGMFLENTSQTCL